MSAAFASTITRPAAVEAASRIVFLHGFPTSSHIWRDVVPMLPAGRRVVVVDLLGYGRSDRPEGRDLSIKGHAERVLALLDVLRISYATIVGHDLGGGIAQYLAVRYPTRVARLALISSVAFDSWPTREVRLVKATLPLTRYLPATWVASVLRSDLLRGYSDEQRGGHSVDMYIRPFEGAEGRDTLVEHLDALDPDETEALAPRLKDIVAPTAIITGAHDPFLGISVAERLHAEIPGLHARGDRGCASLRPRGRTAARGGSAGESWWRGEHAARDLSRDGRSAPRQRAREIRSRERGAQGGTARRGGRSSCARISPRTTTRGTDSDDSRWRSRSSDAWMKPKDALRAGDRGSEALRSSEHGGGVRGAARGAGGGLSATAAPPSPCSAHRSRS